MFDLFGDYLRYRGGEAPLQVMVGLMSSFGFPSTTVRVVVTRMRDEGWLSGRRDGRTTSYALTEAAWRLLDEGRARIFDRAGGPWDGNWHLVVYTVSELDRSSRDQLRKKLSWLGFGQLAPSVWISPHDRLQEIQTQIAEDSTVQMDVFSSRSRGLLADQDLAARAWDLPALNLAYTEFQKRYEPRLEAYQNGLLTGAAALVERTELVHDYRMFPFRDPDLPPELVPDGWLGRAAHELFIKAHGLLRAPAEAWVDDVLARAGQTQPRAHATPSSHPTEE
jgi:phenylacetic acid degradation operon negative regulatory protein